MISNLKPVLNAVISNQDKVTKYIHVSSHLMKHFEWDKKKNKVFILNDSDSRFTDRLTHGPVDTWLETVFDFGNRNSRAITSLMPWWIFQEWPVAYCVCHKYVRRGLINIWIEMEFVTMGLRVPDEREMTRSRRPLAPSRSHKWKKSSKAHRSMIQPRISHKNFAFFVMKCPFKS